MLDAGEPSVVTGADGAFAFTGIGPSLVQVGEVAQDGWQRTTPATPYRVRSGFTATADLGNVQLGSLSGVKYDDLDGDGVRDAGEPGIAGWTIFLDRERRRRPGRGRGVHRKPTPRDATPSPASCPASTPWPKSSEPVGRRLHLCSHGPQPA